MIIIIETKLLLHRENENRESFLTYTCIKDIKIHLHFKYINTPTYSMLIYSLLISPITFPSNKIISGNNNQLLITSS